MEFQPETGFVAATSATTEEIEVIRERAATEAMDSNAALARGEKPGIVEHQAVSELYMMAGRLATEANARLAARMTPHTA